VAPYPDTFRIDDHTLYADDPAPKPSERDSLEAGWSWEDGRSSLSATVYEWRTHDEFTDVNTVIGDVLTIQPVNLGQSQSGGLELIAAGRIVTGLDATLSGNVYYKEIDASNLGFDGTQSTLGYEAKVAQLASEYAQPRPGEYRGDRQGADAAGIQARRCGGGHGIPVSGAAEFRGVGDSV